MPMIHRVLVIDDDPGVLALVATAAHTLGLECTRASSANEAVEHVREQSFDLFIIDNDIDGVRGWQVLDYMARDLPKTAEYVVYSSHLEQQDILEYKKRNVNTGLKKPLSRDAIAFAMRRALKL